jgi:thioredoxin 1
MAGNQNMDSCQNVGESEFDLEVSNSSKPVLAVFWAPWSRPCRIIDSVLAEVSATCVGRVKIVKVNADDNPYLSLRFGVESIPTLICFVAGNIREKLVGTASKEAVLRMLRRNGMDDPGQPAACNESMASTPQQP